MRDLTPHTFVTGTSFITAALIQSIINYSTCGWNGAGTVDNVMARALLNYTDEMAFVLTAKLGS